MCCINTFELSCVSLKKPSLKVCTLTSVSGLTTKTDHFPCHFCFSLWICFLLCLSLSQRHCDRKSLPCRGQRTPGTSRITSFWKCGASTWTWNKLDLSLSAYKWHASRNCIITFFILYWSMIITYKIVVNVSCISEANYLMLFIFGLVLD